MPSSDRSWVMVVLLTAGRGTSHGSVTRVGCGLCLEPAGILAEHKRPSTSVSQRVTATPVDKVEHADDKQHHEEIILADHDILL
jgi:hypothetical protein